MSRHDTVVEVHAGAAMGRASSALLRAYPNVGEVFLQEADHTRLAVAVERVEAASPNIGPEQRDYDKSHGGGMVKSLNKKLAVVAGDAGTTARFTLAISAMGLVSRGGSHSRIQHSPGDDKQRMLRSVRTTLRQIMALMVCR